MGRGVQRNHRVARGGSYALADSVEASDDDEPSPYASDGEQQQLADGGESVARQRDFLMALRTVGRQPRGETHEDYRQSVVHAVNGPVLQRAQVKVDH